MENGSLVAGAQWKHWS